jgi:glycine/D-amino acid oxidase-like deaminating enzyme
MQALPPRALPPSLYRDTAPAGPPTPPLRGAHHADVAIVGGGFTGLSTALHLAEAGRSAIVLEAHEPGFGASGRNGGQVNPGLKETPDTVVRDHGADLGGRMVAFSHAAPELVFDLIRRHQIRCEARQGGTLRLATNAASTKALRALAADSLRRNMPVELLEGEALRAATGTAFYPAGLLDRRGGDLNPLAYARGLARAAQQAGAAVHGATPVRALRPVADGWELTTPEGQVTAAQVVLATNGYTDTLWPGLQQSVVPVFSAIAATEPMPEALARTVLPLRASVFETGRITVYYRVDQERRLVLGGRGPMRAIDGPAPLGHFIRHAERLWPGLRGIRWTHGWNGQLAITTDHYPHVHALAPGLYACLGYNGRGVAMATAMGRQLTNLLDGGTFDMPFSPVRQIPLHRFWRVGAKAKILRGRALDRLGL